ncbi:hypothetical protein [Chelativorans salis]|uniref:Uncharacterized protein n=1 Tax=Chelativorans salis TaxID=2978478 RepID=A0ABT2LT94_9HYPH|nr:hypothetical protein [Chelativorans sp. EGI FJ00035]MCT7377279.1 hypothetical protein [Chelativorans sp. EGI FJ00035]
MAGEILDVDDLVVEKREPMVEAAGQARKNRTGFSDVMVASGNLSTGCARAVAFDRHAGKRSKAMELLS